MFTCLSTYLPTVKYAYRTYLWVSYRDFIILGRLYPTALLLRGLVVVARKSGTILINMPANAICDLHT